MIFLFKKKKIVVDCFTPLRGVYEVYKPQHSIEYWPEHIKNMNSTHDIVEETSKITIKRPTIKSCAGLIEYYKTGFILPMWADFACQPKTAVEGSSGIGFMEKPFFFDHHRPEQYPGIFPEHIHVKLASPWMFKEKTGVKFSWNSAVWNLQNYAKNFVVLPGVVSYNYQCQTNVNIFVDTLSDNFLLTAGTPLVQITPISEHKVELRHHLVDQKEFAMIDMPSDFTGMRPGRYNRWIKEKTKLSEKRKCPFGFGK